MRNIAAAEVVPRRERVWLLRALHDETVGGLLLAGAATIAVAWANSPWRAAYSAVVGAHVTVGPINMTSAEWASDALLAVFFLVVGVELRHEFTVGSLVGLRNALAPVAAAAGGMVAAAALFLLVAAPPDRGAWGVPVSTDVAFALAVLAAAGRGLPVELRVFLLTVAVVNDLGAIVVVAAFYGGEIHPTWGAGLLAAIAGIVAVQRLHARAATFLATPVFIVLAVTAWYCCLRFGVHPTVAGALVGLALPSGDGERSGPGDRALGMLRPLSAGLCVPLFAFSALGVTVNAAALGSAIHDRLLIAIVVGLAVGQPVGVLAGTWIATRSGGRLSSELSWADVAIVGRLAGIGLTVALLVAGVAFAQQPERLAVAKVAVLVAIAVSSATSAVSARLRLRRASSTDAALPAA